MNISFDLSPILLFVKECWWKLVQWTTDFLHQHIESPQEWWEMILKWIVLDPITATILAVIVFYVVRHKKKAWSKMEELNRIECEKCGTLMYQCATFCPSCGAKHQHVSRVNHLGYTSYIPLLFSQNKVAQENLLRSALRCPNCGEWLENKDEVCPKCKTIIWDSDETIWCYDHYFMEKLWKICFLY